MQRGSMTDREAYPTAWITLAVLVLLYLLWRFALGAPTVSRCWVWEHWHVYCPGCGGTRALMALAHAGPGSDLSVFSNRVAAAGKAGLGPAL